MNFLRLFLTSLFIIAISDTSFTQTESSLAIELQDGWKISGSLITTEKESDPLVIFISGSGPTDRNGNNAQMTNNSIKYLAEALAKKGISSYRYDKRGIAASKGDGIDESELLFSTFVNDLNQITQHLKADFNKRKIIIAGHSEGALIGLLVAKTRPDIDAYISIAGAGKDAKSVLLDQLNKQAPMLANEAKIVLDSLSAGHDVKNVNPFLMSIFRPSIQGYIRDWISYDSAKELSSLNIPALIIQGTDDLQVPEAYGERLRDHSNHARYAKIDSMNHVLKITGAKLSANLGSYNDPKLPVSEELVNEIIAFIENL